MSGALATTVVGSYPQPDWLIDRERLGDRLPPRVRARELWRVAEEFLEEAQDDATLLAVQDMERAGVDDRSPTARCGARATRTASPRRSTASTSTTRASRSTARATRTRCPRVVGPIRRTRPVEVRDVEFLRSHHRPPDQDHGARAVHDDPAGAGRPLRRRAEPRACLRRGGQRGAARPQGCRRRRRPDRRAVSAGPARAGARATRSRRSTARSTGSRATRCCTRASATPHIVKDRPSGYPFLAELNDCAATHLSLEAAQPDLDPEVLAACRTRRSSSACSTSARPRRRRRSASPTGSAGRSRSSSRSGSSSRPTAG